MNEKLTIWCNNSFMPFQEKEREFLRKSLEKYNLFIFKPSENGKDGKSAKVLTQADIVFGSPNPETVLKSKKLQWIHLNTAGFTAYDGEYFKQDLKNRSIILTNSSTVYSEPCAQHLLAMILSLSRRLPDAFDEQRGDKSWKFHELRQQINLLNNQIVLIFGFGSIARRLVELLAPLKMKVIGVRRKVHGDETVQIITDSEVDKYLPLADHVINILPENPGTKNYFNAEKFSQIKSSAFFYNIGRGTTIEQNILRQLLEERKIAAAYLDVVNPEPLPPDDLIWTTPNCFITPHIAGGASDEKQRQVEHFLVNLRSFLNDEELIDRIL